MAAQQGFVYEENTAEFLKKFNVVEKNYKPASASSDRPDLELTFGSKKIGVELKITDASAGSLVLKYDGKNWGFNPIAADDTEKQFIADLANRVKLFDRIKKEWTQEPAKFLKVGNLTNPQKYEIDKVNFKDIKGEISASEISKYYNQKDCYYVNIGTHGFYMFGISDPAKFQQECSKLKTPNVPDFSQAASAIYRARVQYKGSGNYQFTLELQFKVKQKSPYNIAPCSKTSVNIIESQFNAPFLISKKK